MFFVILFEVCFVFFNIIEVGIIFCEEFMFIGVLVKEFFGKFI